MPMLAELLDDLADCFDRETAKKVVRLSYEAKLMERLDELARKRPKTLDDASERELLLIAEHFLEHMKKRSRAILRKPKSTAE